MAMAMARRSSCVKAMIGSWAMPAMDRLWWWLAVVSLFALLGQEIARTSAIALAAASLSDFEGFGDEWEEAEEEPALVLAPPPPVHRRPGFETDHGPPPAKDAMPINPSETLAPPAQAAESAPPSPPSASKVFHRHEYWDEDEFEGLPEEHTSPPSPDQAAASSDPAFVSAPLKSTPPPGPRNFYIEIACVLFLIFFAIAYFLGKKENEKIALAWAAQFACKDGIFDKNFSLLGTSAEPDSPLLIKEGQNFFKFYASGRRFCRGLLATMDLQCRHDLITCMWYFVSPRRDEMTIDVFMNDENMEPLTFALVRKKNAKNMLKDSRDLQIYAGAQAQRTGLSDELTIISEFRDLAHDLITDTVLDQVNLGILLDSSRSATKHFVVVNRQPLGAKLGSSEEKHPENEADDEKEGLNKGDVLTLWLLIIHANAEEIGGFEHWQERRGQVENGCRFENAAKKEAEISQNLVFGERAFEKFGKDFVSLHFTDEFPLGTHKKILRFKFSLPSVNSMGDMSRLIALVPYYIDLLGRYKLTAQLRAKADAARAKVVHEAFKEAQSTRQEALQKKKQERRRAIESAESKLTVEALRKREEKERLRQMKKSMPRIKVSKA